MFFVITVITTSALIAEKAKVRVGILFGSYCPNTNGARIVSFIAQALQSQGAETEILSAAELNIPFLTAVYEANKEEAPAWMRTLYKRLSTFDAFVLVSGVYNKLPQPGLLNMINLFFTAYKNKPAGIVSYSVSSLGGVQIEGALRTSMATLDMLVIPQMLTLPKVHEVLSKDGTPAKKHEEALLRRSKRFMKSLLWYATTLKTAQKRA